MCFALKIFFLERHVFEIVQRNIMLLLSKHLSAPHAENRILAVGCSYLHSALWSALRSNTVKPQQDSWPEIVGDERSVLVQQCLLNFLALFTYSLIFPGFIFLTAVCVTSQNKQQAKRYLAYFDVFKKKRRRNLPKKITFVCFHESKVLW